jgi:hypothetical protein
LGRIYDVFGEKSSSISVFLGIFGNSRNREKSLQEGEFGELIREVKTMSFRLQYKKLGGDNSFLISLAR